MRLDILDILDIIRPSPGFTWTTAPRIGPEAPEAGPLTFSFDAMKRSSLQREAPGWPSELVEDLSRWPLKGPGTVACGWWRMKDEGLNLPSAYLVSYLMLFHHLQWTLGPFIDELYWFMMIYLQKMRFFHSYVKLPEGNSSFWDAEVAVVELFVNIIDLCISTSIF